MTSEGTEILDARCRFRGELCIYLVEPLMLWYVTPLHFVGQVAARLCCCSKVYSATQTQYVEVAHHQETPGEFEAV